MKYNSITISREEFLEKFAEATAEFAAKNPKISVVFTMTSVLVCRVVTNALFGEEDT